MTYTFPSKMKLDSLEVMMALQAGVIRCWDSTIQHQRSETYGSSRTGTWQRHIEGALAEYSVAKLLGLFWPGPGKLFAPNIPKRVQVSHTELPNGKLIVHPDADDDQLYFFVTGCSGDYIIEGWAHAGEVKLPELWSDPGGYGRPAYFVPKSYLRETYTPPSDLRVRELEEECRRWDAYARSLEQQLK